MLSLVKLAVLTLNAGTSATAGSLFSYYMFKGEDKEEQKAKIKEVYDELDRIKRDFELEREKIEKEEASQLAAATGRIKRLESIQNCLSRMEDSYKRQIAELGWTRIFKIVKYKGESCQ